MSGHTPWREVRERLDLDERAVAAEKLKIRLAILREASGMNQAELADALGMSQSNISQLERGDNQRLSSVARYVHALGGRLQVSAVMGDTTYVLVDDETGTGVLDDSRMPEPA